MAFLLDSNYRIKSFSKLILVCNVRRFIKFVPFVKHQFY